jgi:hypothetical protein
MIDAVHPVPRQVPERNPARTVPRADPHALRARVIHDPDQAPYRGKRGWRAMYAGNKMSSSDPAEDATA